MIRSFAQLGCGFTVLLAGVAHAQSPLSDDDADGLTLAEEERGWTITVNRTGLLVDPVTGFEDAGEVYEVASDPSVADTDGDGLLDGEERAAKCDPTMNDTDMDGLSDFAEVVRWGTSPTSVDTDGDARGFLADRSVFPYAALFDGAELQLVRGDDGVDRPGARATSPILDDTDGDGLGDYEETMNPLRSPVVAETPKIDMRLAPDTMIEITLNAVKTDGSNEAVSYATAASSSQTWSLGGSATIGNETEWYTEAELKASVKATAGTSASASASVSDSVRTGIRTTTTVSATISGGFAQEASKTEAEARAAELRSEVTLESGTVRVVMELTNTSEQTFTIGTIGVVVGTGHGVLGFVPLGTLTSEAGAITLGPGDRAQVALSNTELPVERVMGLTERPGALVFLPTNVDLLDEDGVDFDFRAEAIRQSTALVEWAPAPGAAELHYVAANVSRDGDAEPDGVILGDALLASGIGVRKVEVEVEGAAGGTILLYDLGNGVSELHQGAAPSLGDPPYVHSEGPGQRFVRAGWFAYILRDDPARLGVPLPADWSTTRLYARDKATLIRSIDNDRDGVPAHLELSFGSFDDATDSDQDGLSDFYEIAEGWTVDVFGAPPERVFPSPAEPDRDQDGLIDSDEQAHGTHPDKADTDGDGISDFIEVQLEGSATDANTTPPKPQVSCTLVPTSPPPGLVQRGVCDFEYSNNDSQTSRGNITNGCRCSAAVRVARTQTPFHETLDWAYGSFLETCGTAGTCVARTDGGVQVPFPCSLLRPGKAMILAQDDRYHNDLVDDPDDSWIAAEAPLGSEVLDYGGGVEEGDFERVTSIDGSTVMSCGNYTPWSAPRWAGCPLMNAQGNTCAPESASCRPILNSIHWIFGGNPSSPADNDFDLDGHSFVPELVDPLLVKPSVANPSCSYFNHIPCGVADRVKDDYVLTRKLVIDVNDPQGDLVSVVLDLAIDHFRSEWLSDPPGVGQHHELPTGFAGTPGNFVVTATDAWGMRTQVSCAAGTEE